MQIIGEYSPSDPQYIKLRVASVFNTKVEYKGCEYYIHDFKLITTEQGMYYFFDATEAEYEKNGE
ncbi:hypothetical protein [Klebsiella sp. GB_Kp059]|uniref:hypothetical protein n=1 Tax=Klebsiella sp. GB_Kp059 TaxID=3153407 RepID=UPI0032B5093E